MEKDDRSLNYASRDNLKTYQRGVTVTYIFGQNGKYTKNFSGGRQEYLIEAQVDDGHM